MSKSTDNLWAAFAGESQANRKYTAFSRKADDQGYVQAAKLFRAAAAAETVHALSHFKALDGVSETADNIRAAIAGEDHEAEVMYPEFIATAEAEGEKKALTTFKWAFEVEKTHRTLFQSMLENLDSEETFDYYVCPICGHTHERNAPDKCPVCGASGDRFERIS
ncbi:MAG: rubrerythrin [Deltaproteobacteria bacterium]|nr:MAG: rubrerythrin [Deltaproteobacteria bacterium]